MVRVLLISLLLVGFVPLSAQAGLLDFFFPSLRSTDSDPTREGYAPFASVPENTQESGILAEIPEGEVPLDKPHRLTGEISSWVAGAVGESLNFESQVYTQDFAKTPHFFTAAGRGQYESFLKDKNIFKVLETEQYYVRSYVEDTPLLLNEGAVNEVYRWLYRVPVVITYMDRGMKTYKDAKVISQRAVLDIQVGRSASPQAKDGLIIELWSGRVEPLNEAGKAGAKSK